MNTHTSKNKEVVLGYFEAFGQGDMEAVWNYFHSDCYIVSVRAGERASGQLHGSYQGKEQARTFLSNITHLFNTQKFQVHSVMDAEDQVVYAHGEFAHQVKATGKLFLSDWVQRCVIEGGKIKEYRFYEDSAAFEVAAN